MNSTDFSDHFPNEILGTIFELLCLPRTISSTGDLHSCVLVNRQWHNVAMRILWHTIHLDVDGNKVQDIHRDPTRAGLKYHDQDHEDPEDKKIWNDWENWLEGGDNAFSTTDCWGDTLPRPFCANMLGVRPYNLDLLFRSTQCLSQQERPFWMIYNSPFDLCRKITVSFVDHSKTAKNKDRIIAIILSCTNLRDFDMFLHLQKIKTRDKRRAWIKLSRHLSSQPLRTLRIRLKWAKDKLLPISFTHTENSNQFDLPFYILWNRLTHLSLELDHAEAISETETNFSNFERLKFFAIYECPEDSIRQPSRRISRLLQSVQVEEMGFSWPCNITTLPLTLIKLSIITCMDGLQVMLILKRLVNLEIFINNHAPNFCSTINEIEGIQNQSVENEVIACRRLRVLHFNGTIPKYFFQVIASQCPLLNDIELDYRVPENVIFAIIDQCKELHSITFEWNISDNVLSYLRYSKNLVNITLYMDDLPNVVMLKSFLKELPLLQRLYLLGWLEEDCELYWKDLVSDGDWTEAEVNQTRRYMKPHHDGHDYMYLDIRAMRINYWMNDMELAE